VALGLASGDLPRDWEGGGEWDGLSDGKRAEMIRKMAVYAAMVERMDRDIGRVIGDLEKEGEMENTFVIFLSDNGASAEGGPLGGNFRPDLRGPIGSVDSYHSYGRAWADVSNTPLKGHKALVYEGGIRTPCIVHWPRGMDVEAGSVTGETAHLIDLMPTLIELTGADYPGGKAELQGVSLAPVLRGGNLGSRTLGWEHFGAAAWREGDWKLVRRTGTSRWELYDLAREPCEGEDLAKREPERLSEMAEAWEAWARRMGVKR